MALEALRESKASQAPKVILVQKAIVVTLALEARKVYRARLAEMVSAVRMALLAREVRKAPLARQVHRVQMVCAAHKVSKAKLVQWELEALMVRLVLKAIKEIPVKVCQQVERPVSI